MLNYGRHPLPPYTVRREQERAALHQTGREAVDAWAERLQEMD